MLILIANPGSASRKYGLFKDQQNIAQLHYEYVQGRIECTVTGDGEPHHVQTDLRDLREVSKDLPNMLKQRNILKEDEHLTHIGLRVVAPNSYFLRDHVVDDDFIRRLQDARERAPLHVDATLHELLDLREVFPDVKLVGISDSAFHATKPDYAWNYGVRLQDADRFEIKRYGYHGISVASVVHQLKEADKLPPRVIVAHLGSGASITAVHGGHSLDTTMGYSPLEGLVMATRVGTIDPTAANVLQSNLRLDDEQMEDYLNSHSGLLGLSGISSAINELLDHEAAGNHNAHLALETYIFAAQKAIGSMAAAMAGADLLVFTGTVGERSAAIRKRIIERLHYMDFVIDDQTNDSCNQPTGISLINRLAHSKPIIVMPTQESEQMVRRVLDITNQF